MEQPARQEQPDPVNTPVSALPLQRSAENRVIGGVCGGLAEYTDIDPIVYRVLAAVLTLVGGAGLILYGAAMLLVPDARTGTAPLGRLFSGGRLRAAGVALAIVCMLVVVGGLTGVFGGASLSIVVIAVLVVLVAHRRGVILRDVLRGQPSASRASTTQQTPPPQVGPYAPQPQPFTSPTSAPAYQQQAPPPPADAPPMRLGPQPPPYQQQQPSGDASTVRMPVPPPQSPPPPQGYVDLSTMPPGPPERPSRKTKLPSITGWVWLLAALAGGAVAWLQDSGEIHGDIRVPLAVALAVLGLGLVISTWVGRASVKAWGVLLTITLGVATFAAGPMQQIRWQPTTWTPASAAQLAADQPYDVGVGSATLDLTELPMREKQTYPAKVTMTAGEMVVLVPKSAAVDLSVRCDGCTGDALGHTLDGPDIAVDERVEPGESGRPTVAPEQARPSTKDAPVIDLDIDVNVGEVKVRRAP